MRAPAFLCGLMLAVCGCAPVPPQHTASFDIPKAWSGAEPTEAAQSTPLAAWWLYFDDPMVGRLVSQALRANTRVKGAEAALRRARALRDASAAALWPVVGSSASAQRGIAGGTSTGNLYRVGLDASWELDIFGANRSALQASEAGAAASASSLGQVQVSIAAEVALAYIALRNAQARVAIAGENLEAQLELLQITQWRYQAGLVSALDAEQAAATAEQTRALVPLLRAAVAQNGHALSVLTGQPPAALSMELASPTPVPRASESLALALPAETLRQRPDVRAAEYEVAAAAARVSQAGAALAPSFRLGGSLGLAATTVSVLADHASVVGSLLAGVTLPIFEGGALRAQVRAQEAALGEAWATYDATVLAALQEVEDALAALRGDRDRLQSLQRASEAATNALLMARQRYGSGLIDFQVVLDAQRTQLATQEGVAGSTADLGADHVRLFKALGGGWIPDETAGRGPSP